MLAAAAVPHELLVQFAPIANDAARSASRASVQAALVEKIHTPAMAAAGEGVLERVRLPDAVSVDAAVKALQNNPHVRYAEPNWIYQPAEVSNDPYYTTSSRLWGMYSDDSPASVGPSGTTNQYGSQAEEAWNSGYIGNSSVVVGIIDEGFQYTHPDLDANSWTNPFDPVDGVDNDGNGYVDDIHGWDFFNNDNSTYDGTADDHGTHVAGTIGGEGGNGIGVAGVNWQTTMISAKFLGPNGGYTSGAVAALDYLADLKVRHGINIVATNNSWGGGGFSQALLDAITRAANQGILFIAAAGNSSNNNDTAASYPSNYNTTAGAGYDAVIAVAAIDSAGAKASFSSYGATTVDLGAPGVSINSTVPTDSYASYSGTSMATPHVTGAAALYKAYKPGVSASAIRSAILNSTTPTTSLNGITVTGGRLNISALMQSTSGPTLSINDVTVTEGDSGTKTASFTVTLSAASASPVTVAYATANGTATADGDYLSAGGTLTFNNETTKTIDVTINGDTTSEPNETFFVNLSNASGATIADSQGRGTIQNDDNPGMSINDPSITEGNAGKKQLKFTIALTQPATSTVTVQYATANGTATTAGSDYRAKSGSASISAGQSSTTISITVNGDRTAEPNETFFVNLSNAVNAVLTDNQGTGTIVNDDGAAAGGAQAALVLNTLNGEIDSLIAQVLDSSLDDGIKRPLVGKLTAAKESLQRGNTRAAANQLRASINFLTALKRGGQLDGELADSLIEEIAGIQSTLD